MKNHRFLLIVLLLALFLVAFSAAVERPTYTVHRTEVPVTVDGRVDDAAWQKAELIDGFADNTSGKVHPSVTKAWVLYDDTFLYFGFHCEDGNVWATYRNRDEHLWTEEVFEVFLQADPEQPSYIELEVNPLNTMLDIYLLDIRKPLKYESWNSADLKWAVNVDGTVDGEPGDRGWSCEIALPLDDVATAPNIPPKVGDTWRMNLYRVEKKPVPLGLAWAPTLKRDFHVPEMFGDIVFGKAR
jgi:hypothetical protein